MNYTEKYHLPQWEENDRVMRTDFNQMCADMEAGLVRNGQDAQEGLAAAGDKMFDLLCRAAYNHYCYIRELESVPRQIGVFHQGFDKSMAGVTGIGRKANYGWMTTGETAFTSEEFRLGMKEISSMKVVKNDLAACVPEVLEFHTTAPGLLRRFSLPGSFRNGEAAAHIWRITLYNITTGATEFQKNFQLGTSTSSTGNYIIQEALYFWSGYDYRLEIAPVNANYDGTFRYSLESSLVDTECYMYAEGTAVHTFQEGETSRGGIAVIRYNVKADTGAVWLEWDGERMEPDRVRDVTEKGIAMKEAEFRRDKLVPAESTLTLRASCQVNGEVYLYSWGAVLL